MNPIRTLIVDDEPPARAGVRSLLRGDRDFVIAGECANGAEAVRAIRAGGVDLVLLDIEMPGLDGFGVIHAIGAEQMPTVVFLTAHDNHAVDAYENAVIDYLVKPFSADRFGVALQRAKRAVRQPAAEDAGRYLSRFELRLGDRRWTIPVADVDWIEADDYVAKLHVGDRVHVTRQSLAAFTERLDPALFVRTHRSTIVNISRVKELRALAGGVSAIVLLDGTRVPLSRRHREHVRKLLGLS